MQRALIFIAAVCVATTVAVRAVEAQDTPKERSKWTPIGGLHFGRPAGISLAGGVGRVLKRSTTSLDFLRSVFIAVEPGTKGGRASLGFAQEYGNLGTYWSARATLFRRWKGANQPTYAGVEVAGARVFAMGLRTGIVVPTSKSPPSQATLWTIDFAIGY